MPHGTATRPDILSGPLLVLDQHPRTVDELFDPSTRAALETLCRVEGSDDAPMPPERLDTLLPDASFLVAARPALDRDAVARAASLRAIIEVSGAFQRGLDYAACFERGIEVLSCAPGFRESVAEMTVAMMLAGGRGLVAEHEAFRSGTESWLDDRPATDFSLHRQTIGFVGYGQIAREAHRLLAPFRPTVLAHDPWLTDAPDGVELTDLDRLMRTPRVVVVVAVPTTENRHLVGAREIALLQPGALVVLVGRAHSVDFEALVAAAGEGRITAAIDVFPDEPVPPDDGVRRTPNVILSPHRAAAVPGGRRLIGELILHDVRAILDGRPERQLRPADPDRIETLSAAQDEIGARRR